MIKVYYLDRENNIKTGNLVKYTGKNAHIELKNEGDKVLVVPDNRVSSSKKELEKKQCDINEGIGNIKEGITIKVEHEGKEYEFYVKKVNQKNCQCIEKRTDKSYKVPKSILAGGQIIK